LILRRRSLEGFCLVAFLLLCIPYTQLFPFITNSLVADRFLSLPVWPAMLLLVALAWRLKRVPRTVLLISIALAGTYQTVERPRDWHSFETLIDADMRAFPGYAMPASYQVINLYTHGLIREAIQTAATISDPELRDVLIGLIKADSAVTYTEATRNSQQATMTLLWKLWLDHKELPAQAKWNTPVKNLWVTKENMFSGEWLRLLASFPDDMSVRYNAGSWMLDAQKYRDAITYLRDAAGSHGLPADLRGVAYERLGVALMKSGQVAEAETALNAALQQTPPELRAYCSLAKIYRQSGRLEQAIRASKNCTSVTK
jgi:tetratricopeptide (TPR) repeat protein